MRTSIGVVWLVRKRNSLTSFRRDETSGVNFWEENNIWWVPPATALCVSPKHGSKPHLIFNNSIPSYFQQFCVMRSAVACAGACVLACRHVHGIITMRVCALMVACLLALLLTLALRHSL